MSAPGLATRVLAWFDEHGRKQLPWQHPRSAYRVWVAEVMLQQTQVATVIPFFERFIAAFPDADALASAPLDAVLARWSGLGYYSRARNLKRAAEIVVREHGGVIPADTDALEALPGIGRSTAGAIAAQAFGVRAAILDGNVKRLIARLIGEDRDLRTRAALERLWSFAAKALPDSRMPDYTQALMDLGALVCTPRRPRCDACPVAVDCVARATDRIDTIPFKSRRAPVPTRAVAWLVAERADGALLLERRPEFGVWGGLWSFPEFADGETLKAALAREGVHGTPVALASFTHVFTHFKLAIAPWLAAIPQQTPAVAETDRQIWIKPDAALALGLPRATRMLIESRTASYGESA